MEKLTKIEPFVENVSGTRSALWRVVCRRRTRPALCGTRHLQLSLPSPALTCHLNNHQPTIGLISKRIKNGRVATMQLYIGLLRLENSQFSLSAWALPGCGAALEHRIPDTEKQEFPATTILMFFIINYYFSINSL